MREDKLPEDERGLLDPGSVPQHVKDATDRMLAEEGYTAEKALMLRALERQKSQRGATQRMRAIAATSILHGFASNFSTSQLPNP